VVVHFAQAFVCTIDVAWHLVEEERQAQCCPGSLRAAIAWVFRGYAFNLVEEGLGSQFGLAIGSNGFQSVSEAVATDAI
jgi:hypothetical protein